MADVFTVLAADHVEVKAMLAELGIAPWGLHAVLPVETAGELGRKIAEGRKTAATRPSAITDP